jgi:hypothetical protein
MYTILYIILTSCNLICFERLCIDCNVENDTEYFYEDEIRLNFSVEPDFYSLEKINKHIINVILKKKLIIVK